MLHDDSQEPTSIARKSNEAPDGLGSIDTLRGMVPVKLATTNIMLINEN
jgi:hypothetical protein